LPLVRRLDQHRHPPKEFAIGRRVSLARGRLDSACLRSVMAPQCCRLTSIHSQVFGARGLAPSRLSDRFTSVWSMRRRAVTWGRNAARERRFAPPSSIEEALRRIA
jgi:hypothetical protein